MAQEVTHINRRSFYMVSVSEFIREYTRALAEGYAAVFAGAGLSRASGFVNWKGLIEPLARDIGLDVEKEHDLVAVAQYYKNERCGRAGINQRILNEFTQNVEINENIRILTRFPISTYWTTNYDSLLEDGLKENNRKADVKVTQASLAENIYDRDAIVYKMHGDAKYPDSAVLTKDDYESYINSRPLFRTALQGDLISKTFLFVGFSFEDPNLDYVLSQIRLLLGESSREHYCFFEKVTQYDGEASEDYTYRKVKQEFRIKDLQRYGIQAVLLDNYDEIQSILKEIENKLHTNHIFISGSISNYSAPWTEEAVNSFAFGLAKQLVKDGNRIISGFGLGIGSSVINGALNEIMNSKYKHVDEHLCLRPFPQYAPDPKSLPDLWTQYRKDMIAESGIAVFMFGNKYTKNNDGTNEELVIANGMLEEFRIAKDNSSIIIPIGSTGWAAQQIFDEVEKDIGGYPYLKDHIDILRTCTDSNILINCICNIVKCQKIF